VTDFSRQAVWWLEIKPDRCTNTYGVAPCTAAGAAGTECYNTFGSCQDKPNYVRGTKSYHFCSIGVVGPSSQLFRPYIEAVKTSPTEINRKDGLARRTNASVTLLDEPDSDIQQDPYIATRAAAQGTFFSRFIARNLHLIGREAILRRAYLTGAWDDSAFSAEHYIIESISGPDKGKVVIKLKDKVKLADRVKVPTPTSGKLTAEITASDVELPLSVGSGEQYPADGYVRIKDEVLRYASKKPSTGWGFNNSLDSWAGTNVTLTARASTLLYAATAADSQMRRSGLSFWGGTNRYVVARLRRIAGSGWDGTCFYTTAGHGESGSYYKNISAPSWAAFENALKWSEDFSQSVWGKVQGSITSNAAIAPDGNTTADKFIPNTTVTNHYIDYTLTGVMSFANGEFVATDVFLKAAGYRYVNIVMYYAVGGGTGRHGFFDLQTGEQLSNLFGIAAAGIEIRAVGNGWYRLFIANQVTDAGTYPDKVLVRVRVLNAVPDASNWAGDGSSGIYLVGGGCRKGAALTPYAKTEDLPAGEFVIAVWDMHALTAGGTDWQQSTITGLRLDFGNSSADQFEVDWIAYGGDPRLRDDVLVLPDSSYRAQFDTVAAVHKIDAGAQLCKVWSNAAPTTVIRDILDDCGVDFEHVDVPGFALEDANWLQAFRITTCVSDPETGSKLIAEICQQTNAVSWWNAALNKQKYKVIGPVAPGETIGRDLTDLSHLLDDSVKVSRLDDRRISFVAISYNLENATADQGKPASFLNTEIHVDADAESANEYNDQRNANHTSRWFGAGNENAMRALASRTISAFRDAPHKIDFTLTPKDADVEVGGLYPVTTDGIVDFDGAPKATTVLITRRVDDGKGLIQYSGETTVFGKRYGFIGPNGMPDYTGASAAQQEYAFICNSAGAMSNGDDCYRIS